MKNLGNNLLKIVKNTSERFLENELFPFEKSSKSIFLNNHSYYLLKNINLDFNKYDNIFCDGIIFSKLCMRPFLKNSGAVWFNEEGSH